MATNMARNLELIIIARCSAQQVLDALKYENNISDC
jgi:hypothetical protein